MRACKFVTCGPTSRRSVLCTGNVHGLAMIMEERIYTFAPGKLQPYIDRFVVEALPIMRRHLGEPVGCFVTESGDLNQLVHLWRYQSMADREIRRAAMYKDPDWLDY